METRSPHSTRTLEAMGLDPRLIDALRKFSRHEIALFAPPVAEEEVMDAVGAAAPTLAPGDPETFQRLSVCLALHRLDVPAVSYDEAYLHEEGGGGQSSFAIDGAAIAVGDEPIIDVESARAAALEAVERRGPSHAGVRSLRPRLLLVRANMETSVGLEEIEQFGRDAQRLLTRDPEELLDESMEHGRIAKIFGMMRVSTRGTETPFEPKIDLVYAFPGEWRRTQRTDAALAVRGADLRAAYPGAEVNFTIWGADELISAYERVALSSIGVLKAARLMALPKVESNPNPVTNGRTAFGWIGVAPASSIVDLVIAQDGAPDPRLFYDNVRHYLGADIEDNPGAAGLAQTLRVGEAPEVVLRHNGVTIVARGAEFQRSGDRRDGAADLMLREFQIVNGAQTVFTLCSNQEQIEGAHLPIKVVVTEDERVKDGVVLGANTQSAVDRFDMLARRQELRALQHAFDAAPPGAPEKLWLQRRRAEPFRGRVSPQRIVTPRQLMEGFASAILGIPHRVHDNPLQLLEEVPEKIFNRDHEPTAYLAVGWLIVAGRRWAERRELYWADRLGQNRADAYPARHQFIYALFRMVDEDPEQVELGHGPDTAARFRPLLDVFATRDGAALADLAGVIVREAAAGQSLTPELVRQVGFTDAVRRLTDEARSRIRPG